ncbi:MAG: choice-of-anchor B family protein [Gammaproteobacteria bacterium]|nr:choice-of-anchor B family protein [Gammaproteobacteria bacterium]MDH3467487.1 choice-of-anchor B family protein [Gammaproteobacteria bacterium]
MKSSAVKFLGIGFLIFALPVAGVLADDADDAANADPFELILADDGVASLPLFKGPFPETENMIFLSQIDPEDLGALPVPGVWAKGMMNDIGGWTSPNGEEYALAPNSGGIAIVRVTDPENPEFLGRVESQNPFDFRNIWGDPDTFGNYAYFTTEIDDSSIVIIDMSGADALPAVDDPFTDLPLSTFFVAPGGYDGSHNIVINKESGFAYTAGTHLKAGAANNACGTEQPARFNTLILDLNADPTNPPVVACIENAGEHDFHVVNYTGPDADYVGREILFVFDGRDREGQAEDPPNPVGGKTLIWDVTDKNSIVEIASFRLPGLVFSHNGATTAEQDFLFIGDEIDELVLAGWSFSFVFAIPVDEPTNKPQTGTYVIDIRDLDNPVLFDRYEDGTVGLDHNFVVEDGKLIIASYTSGARVLEIGRDGNGDVSLSPAAVMDTEPRLQENILNINQEEKFGSAFLGQWGIFAFPDSDTIIASDINNGLIVMKLSDQPCKGIKCSK